MKKVIEILLGCFVCLYGCLCIPSAIHAQTDIQMSQHMFNRINYNPAATGASRYVCADLLLHKQWTDWEGAPSTQVLNIHNYFPVIHSGGGMTFMFDRLGNEKYVNWKTSFAFHAQLTDRMYLSMGLAGGVLYRAVDYTSMRNQTSVDPDFSNWDLRSKTNIDFDLGFELNHERFSIGIASTHFTRSSTKDDRSPGRHFYGYAKYNHPIGVMWDIIPSAFIQHNQTTTHVEISCLALMKETFWFGVSYRGERFIRSEAMIGYVGFWYKDLFRIGYSYDFHLGKLSKYSGGTHEVLLSLRIKKRPSINAKTPRFFE